MEYLVDPLALNLDVRSNDGDEVWCVCPFHDDHSPSATFNVVSGLFHCFTCGTGKNLKQLEMELGGQVVYVKSLDRVRNKISAALDNSWRVSLMAPLAFDDEYLAGRNVTNGYVSLYQIRKFPYGIGFPITNNLGQVTGMQIRQLPPREPRYLFNGQRQPLWPLKNLNVFTHPDRPTILTEGVFSALRVIASGYNALAVMGVANILPAIRMMMGRDYLVLFDGDEAGYIGAAKFAAMGKSVVLVPNGFEADEVEPLFLAHFLDNCKFTDEISVVAEQSQKPRKTYQLAKKFQKTARKGE